MVFIPVTRRVKGYNKFVRDYVTVKRKRFRPYKVCIYIFIRMPCPSVRLSVRMNSHKLSTAKRQNPLCPTNSLGETEDPLSCQSRLNPAAASPKGPARRIFRSHDAHLVTIV